MSKIKFQSQTLRNIEVQSGRSIEISHNRNNSRRWIPFLDSIYIIEGGQCRKGNPFLTSMKVLVPGCLPSYQPYWIMVITRSHPYDTSYPLKSLEFQFQWLFCLRSREPFDEENLCVLRLPYVWQIITLRRKPFLPCVYTLNKRRKKL